ncbi:rhodanese domain protein [Chloroherpeton thalassium ATCC 35110]|uniref:Rhodanese domain protein n=1 Tax=Chloroherpeton thalassium (strain ATCC 35110 / GB-78) TaxID=517418 RepID=B3QW43_CHLT3|nr:YeeE/YedE thiosulfate transporter family protein [Chloroherpeton thalassium]ACF14697.1 rhodanese domain protein [Chloroherpeton thalassium ATCC 35110]
MGPLVPDIIGNELNLVVALFIGLLFGAILEQAGFSTSKKLVGLFYGYDFTVLRVFFTAGTVAMVGVIVFDHFGLLDISVIYINPTFLWSALIGGAIMGLGFVIGGFCPGTSICAAAIGKQDAMFFILGSVFGILFFTEGYPLLEDLYKGSF